MSRTQPPASVPVESSGGVAEHDPIDLIVPPPRSKIRAWGIAALIGVALAAVPVAPASGVLSPRLTAEVAGWCFTPWCTANSPNLSLRVRNDGWVGADITEIDATAEGLGTPRVRVRPERPVDWNMEGGGQLPIHLEPGETVNVYLFWDGLNCREIGLNTDVALPAKANGPLRIPMSVGLDPEVLGLLTTGRDTTPWAQALTLDTCRPR